AQPRSGSLVRSESSQELQRNRLSELEVVGAIDLAHTAAPEASNDTKAIGEQRPGAKAAFIRSARTCRCTTCAAEPIGSGQCRVARSAAPTRSIGERDAACCGTIEQDVRLCI